jgi:hypothetical protein
MSHSEISPLNKFISRLGECNLPFFKIMMNIINFEWTPDCQKAFEELKAYLSYPKILSQPTENESLILYFGVSDQIVSVMLVREEKGI